MGQTSGRFSTSSKCECFKHRPELLEKLKKLLCAANLFRFLTCLCIHEWQSLAVIVKSHLPSSLLFPPAKSSNAYKSLKREQGRRILYRLLKNACTFDKRRNLARAKHTWLWDKNTQLLQMELVTSRDKQLLGILAPHIAKTPS